MNAANTTFMYFSLRTKPREASEILQLSVHYFNTTIWCRFSHSHSSTNEELVLSFKFPNVAWFSTECSLFSFVLWIYCYNRTNAVVNKCTVKMCAYLCICRNIYFICRVDEARRIDAREYTVVVSISFKFPFRLCFSGVLCTKISL